MKPPVLLTVPPLTLSGTKLAAPPTHSPAHPTTLTQITANGTPPKESIRHILLGSTDAIRQTIHLLHTLHYAETVLWSPVLPVEEQLTITPAQGEMMSLLRRHL